MSEKIENNLIDLNLKQPDDEKDSEEISTPKSDHYAPPENNDNTDLEKEYDFGSSSSRRDSDEGSWETVSEELREEESESLHDDELIEHESDCECFCQDCKTKSINIALRVKIRKTYENASLPENVSKTVTEDGSEMYIIGTAHFSEASQDDVKRAIDMLAPDVVMVELCAGRMAVLKYDEQSLIKAAQEINMTKLKLAIKESGSVISGFMQILLLSMSAHITKQLGMAPGGEFRVAAKQARSVPGCRLVLGDRPIQATIGRAMASLSIYQKMRLGFHLIFSKDNITKEDVEKYKQKDMIEEMLAEMTGDFPQLSRVFVDERDQYMAQMFLHSAEIIKNDLPPYIRLKTDDMSDKTENPVSDPVNSDDIESPTLIRRQNYKPVIVGVVGIGHMDGILKNMGKRFDLTELSKIPPPSRGSRAFKIFLKSAAVALVSWGVYAFVSWCRS